MKPDTFLWVYEDRARGLALVRGLNVKSVLESAAVLDVARWSTAGKGYVLPLEKIGDVAAMADYLNTPYRVKSVEASDAQ